MRLASAAGRWVLAVAVLGEAMVLLEATVVNVALPVIGRDLRDVKKAERQAEAAEEDAADALDYALWVVDQAELAVLDAIDARSWADARAAASPPS